MISFWQGVLYKTKLCVAFYAPGKDIGRQISTTKIDVAQACFKDGKWTAASKGDALLYSWEEEPNKTTKEIDMKNKGRHGHKKQCWGSNAYCAWQSEAVASSSSS